MSAVAKILILDANAGAARELAELLASERIESHRVATLAEALAAVDGHACDVVISDLTAAGTTTGPELVRALCQRYPEVPVILVTAEASVEQAIDALRAGALDLLYRPLNRDQIVFVIHKALALIGRQKEYSRPLGGAEQTVFGESPGIREACATMRRAASSTATVLIRGESGTGKELFARAIHESSDRAGKPFVKIDCASLPENLLESELFGYEKGAFTGALARKPGRVELADGGTLFLDEIGELHGSLQAKLLRLLQDRELEHLGGTRVIKVDVRVVTATHRDLEAMAERGQFRQDLFYRLNVIPLWLPPLRARRSDIDPLAKHFCAQFGAANAKPNTRLDDGALRVLREQRWPGNIRQLENFIERLVVLSDDVVLGKEQVRGELSRHARFTTQRIAEAPVNAAVPAPLSEPGPISHVAPLDSELRVAERKALVRALKHADGNRSRAARMLGVSRSTLYVKLQEHDLV
jgi:two-component system, NtrC family, response regulator AtoC